MDRQEKVNPAEVDRNELIALKTSIETFVKEYPIGRNKRVSSGINFEDQMVEVTVNGTDYYLIWLQNVDVSAAFVFELGSNGSGSEVIVNRSLRLTEIGKYFSSKFFDGGQPGVLTREVFENFKSVVDAASA